MSDRRKTRLPGSVAEPADVEQERLDSVVHPTRELALQCAR